MATVDWGPVVLGGNTFGWTSSREESFAVLDAFREAGARAIDTADIYGEWVPGQRGGESEELVGDWMASRGCRDEVVIATKVGLKADRRGLSPRNVKTALEESLRRLRTDHVDVYFAHGDDAATPQADYVEAFSRLVDSGAVGALGASNFTPQRLRSAVELADASGLNGFSVCQDAYNLVQRESFAELAPVVADLGLVEVPHSALAAGFLTGKYRPGAGDESARAGMVAHLVGDPKKEALVDAVVAIARDRGVEAAAVALAWLKAQPFVGAPIASARTTEQLDAIVPAFDLVLSADELDRLEG